MDCQILNKGVCAWPVLLELKQNDRLYCILYNGPNHGDTEGDLECWSSRNAGCSWKRQGIAAPHEPGANRMHIAAGVFQKKIYLLSSGVSVPQKELQKLWLSISADGGKTWNVHKKLSLPKGVPDVIPFGRILFSEKGQLLCAAYRAFSRTQPSRTYILQSKDGVTWKKLSEVGKGDANECTLLRGDKHLFAAVRTHIDHHVELYRSRTGKRWRSLGPLTLPMQHPADLTRLKSGNLLLTYGIRNKGCFAIATRMGSPNGETWTAPFVLKILAQDETVLDCGYPSSLEIAKDKILTAYYSGPTANIPEYSLQSIHWNLQESFL